MFSSPAVRSRVVVSYIVVHRHKKSYPVLPRRRLDRFHRARASSCSRHIHSSTFVVFVQVVPHASHVGKQPPDLHEKTRLRALGRFRRDTPRERAAPLQVEALARSSGAIAVVVGRPVSVTRVDTRSRVRRGRLRRGRLRRRRAASRRRRELVGDVVAVADKVDAFHFATRRPSRRALVTGHGHQALVGFGEVTERLVHAPDLVGQNASVIVSVSTEVNTETAVERVGGNRGERRTTTSSSLSPWTWRR